jgi:hypothetical protein
MTGTQPTQREKRGAGLPFFPIAVLIGSIIAIAALIILERDEAGEQPGASTTPGDPGSTFFRGAIVPGEHTVSIFDPPLSLRIGEGWTSLIAPDDDQIILEGPALFAITRVTEVRDAETQMNIPAPDDLIEWFQAHRNLRADEPVAVTIGGYSARQMDLTSVETVDVIHFPPLEYLRLFQGDRTRITVIDVDGAQIAAITTVDPDGFDAAIAQSQPIVDSLRFNQATEDVG